MDYQQAEQSLLLGVLDALPCPTALLNREGRVVYASDRPCPVSLEDVDFQTVPDVRAALEKAGEAVFRTELVSGEVRAAGFAELYPVRDGDVLLGFLLLFRPDPAVGPASGPLRRMRQAYGRDHVRAMLQIHGNTVEGKRLAARELGISLSTLYRLLGSQKPR